jgi:hypothetical protein
MLNSSQISLALASPMAWQSGGVFQVVLDGFLISSAGHKFLQLAGGLLRHLPRPFPYGFQLGFDTHFFLAFVVCPRQDF